MEFARPPYPRRGPTATAALGVNPALVISGKLRCVYVKDWKLLLRTRRTKW